jgi:DNA polymerase
MGIDASLSDYDWHAALAALSWQVDLGVVEFSVDAPVDRYALPEKLEPVAKPKAAAPALPAAPSLDSVQAAETAARACNDLRTLRAALAAYDHCTLKKGARNLVFADGNPSAHLMLVGDAPSREEDLDGRPFTGPSGQLLDKMLAAIGHARDAADAAKSAYLTTAVPWRPHGDSDPSPTDISMLRPFLLRHIAMIKPRVLIAFGNTACMALLGQDGISRLRGKWGESAGIAVMPMTNPQTLLRNPAAKRDAWADLLDVQARLAQ